MQKVHEIYLLRNKINGKGYVGQSDQGAQKRFKGHCYDAKNDSPKYLHRAMRKYGIENFELSILETVQTQVEADDAEVKWVLELKTLPHEWGYNLTTGGHKTVHTEESRRRNSESTKRTYQEHPELREAISRTQTGKTISQESKDKSSETHKQRFIDNPELREERRNQRLGYKFPPEFGQKISETKLAQNRHCTEEDKQKKREANLAQVDLFRENTLKQFADPEAVERHSQITKEYFEDPANKEKTRHAMYKLYASKRVEKYLDRAPEFRTFFEEILSRDCSDLDKTDSLNALLVNIQTVLSEKPYVPKRRFKQV